MERLETQLGHDLNLVVRRRALAVDAEVAVRCRLAAVAVSREIGRYHREPLSEPGRDLVPHDMGLRIAVQQQYRRPLPPAHEIDRCTRRLDLGSAKPFEQVATPSQTIGAGCAGHDKGLSV